MKFKYFFGFLSLLVLYYIENVYIKKKIQLILIQIKTQCTT